MHYLLIQQAIIDEVGIQVKKQGLKALAESRFDYALIIPSLTNRGITAEERDKWVANLHIEGYLKLTADNHHRNPTYITLLPKGLSAESSGYFKQKYNELRKANLKYWIELFSQFIVGVTAIVAIFMSGKSCNKSQTPPEQTQSVNIYNNQPQTKEDSSRHGSRQNYPTSDEKKVYDTATKPKR